MVDLDVLDAMGSTQARLKEVLTAMPPSTEERALMSEEQIKKAENDCKLRSDFEADINTRFAFEINYALRNSTMYSAVDLAWDAPPINKEVYPLMIYAQGRLDLSQCGDQIKKLPGWERFATLDKKTGSVTGVNLPRFFEVNFNLVRSVITRRLAAQANKYMSLFPYYKYEARSTSQVGKLRADILSQVMDIMADQYDLRHHEVQVMRDAMLYGHSLDFIRARWEKEEQTIFDPDINPELIDKATPKLKTIITKEGIGWINPHPSRIFWDNAHPMASINSDTGSNYIGFWDVIRYGDLAKNTKMWNRQNITYSSTIALLFSTYAQYFSQYYCTITPSCYPNMDLAAANDRLNNIGLYALNMENTAMVIGNYFKRIIPKDWGIGDYPFPVWLRQMVAGDKTVVYAEFIPSSPACYCGINENDSRQLNISIAMELLPYQDQMTQLLSFLLMVLQGDFQRIFLVDIDSVKAGPEGLKMLKDFRADMTGQSNGRPAATKVFEYSGTKMKELGVDVHRVIEMVQTQPSSAVTMIFQAMSQLVQLSERLMALSPHELGQPAPREISATETNMMAGTTETIYGFISDAIDEYRAAKKRVLYESYMVCGSPELRVPVTNRYTKAVIAKAGFKVEDEDADTVPGDDSVPSYHTVIGTKSKLLYHYIFTSRDGALRAVNTQSANVLTQLLSTIQDPVIKQAIPKEKLFEIYNEIFRLSGASIDLNLELQAGESNTLGPDKMAQIEQILQQLTGHAQQDVQQIQQIQQQVQEMPQIVQQVQQLMKAVEDLTGQVEEVAQRPQVDPVQLGKAEIEMKIKEALADQDLAKGRQEMRHAEESHTVDTALKGIKALSMPINGNGNGSS